MNKILLMQRSKPVFIFHDEFGGIDLAAGAVHGTLSTDGKDTRTVVDTENKLSISGGYLVLAGGITTPADGDPGFWHDARVRASGLALFGSVTPAATNKVFGFGFDIGQTGGIDSAHGFNFKATASLNVRQNSVDIAIGAFAATTEYKLCVILRTTGACYYIKGGIYTAWTLVWADAAVNTTPVYPALVGNTDAVQSNWMRLAQLPAPFDTDYGLATQRLAGARVSGNTFTHTADCKIEYTITTVPSSSVMVMHIRQLDTDNYWSIRNTGGVLTLNEIVATVSTQRGISTFTINNGDRIVVIAEGAVIKVYCANVLKITYSSAVNFETATSGKLQSLGTGGAVSDIVSYPRVPASGLQSMLNRYIK